MLKKTGSEDLPFPPQLSKDCNNFFFFSPPPFESRSLVLLDTGKNNVLVQGAAVYQLGNTSSRTITEVKQR